MLSFVQITDVLGLGCLIVALAAASVAGSSKRKHLAEETGEYLAGGALLVAILGVVFVLAE